MKILTFISITIMISFTFVSCGGSSGKESATAEGFSEIEKEIKSEFGDYAYFTNINIVYSKPIGNIVGVTVTREPESLKMEQWNQKQGLWQQNSEISIEVPQGNRASDFMYQLSDQINLKKLGGLVEKSKKQLKDMKDLENSVLSIASIIFPKNGDVSKTEYLVRLQPENGEKTYNFYYQLNGKLRRIAN